MSNVTVIDPSKLPNIAAGGRPQPIIPQNLDDAYRLSKAIQLSGLAPPGFKTAEQIMIAIMHGLEIGLTPLQSLQRLAVINNRVTVWGDGAIGLVRASGLCEFIDEKVSGEGDFRNAICRTKRRGEPEVIARSFSVAQAKKAGLWGKSGPWQQFPDRMLQMRARAFALRDGFADVLGGLYLREEIDDEPKRDAVTTESTPYVERLAGPDTARPDDADEPALPFEASAQEEVPPGLFSDHAEYRAGFKDGREDRAEPSITIGQEPERWALWQRGYDDATGYQTEDR